MELRIPVDFERLPEFRLLCRELRARQSEKQSEGQSDQAVERVAVFIWMRLWVELAYLAQTTNEPGMLTVAGFKLFESTLEPLFGEGCEVAKILCESAILRADPRGTDCFYCERFARMNAHLAGNFKSREVRGAAGSALERNKHHIAREAHQQGMLLPPEMFKKGDGTQMESSEVNRCMVVIKTIDNCLQVRGRKQGEYTEGLIADAHGAAEGRTAEDLRKFYVWLAMNREHPLMPKTTEQVLREFERLWKMAR